MNRKYIYPILVFLITVFFYYAERMVGDKSEGVSTSDSSSAEFHLPSSTSGSIVYHDFYTLSYAEKHEQAEWVAYELKKEHLSQNNFKRPYFEEDKSVRTASAHWRNYKKSGYDRGHLCPAGDRRFTYDAYKDTFLTSNISPQNHEFNSGIWNDLEQQVRYWAKKYDGVHVITGGVLSDNLKSIGYEAVSVPKYFYKIVWDRNGGKLKTIAFLFPHKPSNKSLQSFVVSIDKIEEMTGIDFFASLEDKQEDKIESTASSKGWKL